MEQPSNNKKRTPSRCREWEKQRRIKFNDAISKLGDIVKSIHKANSNLNGEEPDNANYPKIEIVQKAIICLTNIMQEKTQLKAEILALEVKLEAIEKQKQNKKDVSLQVTIGLNKKSQNNKYVKLLMLQNSKENNGKEREKTTILKTKPKTEAKIVNKSPPKLPKLLPLTNMKKENTIVMLPATPYIFPPRPVLFPQPPTIVLVDTNLQTLNKPTTIPVINRNTNDITRTTMVNVLPISAYSRPLSALKSKKCNKARNSSPKKGGKKAKSNETAVEHNTDEDKTVDKPDKENNEKCTADQKTSNTETHIEISKPSISNKDPNPKEATNLNENSVAENNNKLPSEENVDINKTSELTKLVEPLVDKPNSIRIASPNVPCNPENVPKTVSVNNVKCVKITENKILGGEYKSKDNKMPAIIDSTICENVVDGGNARLELAEEFLAASPTAAFLMSFPLVSGNRADSPAEESNNTKETNRRSEITQPVSYFEKSNTDNKTKASIKQQVTTVPNTNKVVEQHKYDRSQKNTEIKVSAPISCVTSANDNPFLNLPLPSIISSSCNLADATFGIDFDCHVTKTGTITTTSHSNTNNFMYKSEPFNAVKSTIYSTSSISSGHEFNSIGLYPCAMDNYTNKTKPDFANVEDNLMKINSSRLTYDIDLGWSHKSFDFVNCTTSANSFHKETILTTVSTPFSTNYNPFNPDFHVPLVPNSNKKNPISKATTFPDQITNFYSQSGNLWSDEVSSIYTNSNVSKNLISKQQNYFPVENLQSHVNTKTANTSTAKQFDTKHISQSAVEPNLKPPTVLGQQVVEKYTKKSPSKMHINWMTSEIRPMQNNCNQTTTEMKETKTPYSHVEQLPKKQTLNESNYFPINMHHFPTQPNHDDIQVWPTARPAGTTEISIDPPPINLPTLVGDLALGPHDKKKADILNRSGPHADLQNCGNFLSVTQLMNRSTENMPQRSNVLMPDQKSIAAKQNIPHVVNDINRKAMPSSQSNAGYGFNDSKILNSYENMNQFLQNKSKSTLKPEKNSKAHKNNYSAEALIRGGTNYNQKLQDNTSNKFMMPAQKYNDFNIQDSGVAQVSHFPPIIDYSDNSYTGQQFSGTALYNSTTNTISNSFYSNFMPGSSNLMSGNYTGAPFSSEFVDYNQTMECNYTNHKYNEVKMRNNTTFQQDKETSNYKSSRRESAAKHKLECSKKDSNKKYQSKRPKIANEVEEWNDTSHLLWQNKPPSKRHQNLMSEEIPFPNYMGNQMPTQYQPDFFNSHIMPSNMQGVGNADRSLASFPVASRANFNLSALFPEITMKVQ